MISNDDTITETNESSQEDINNIDEDEPQLLIDLNPKGMCVIRRFISGHNFQKTIMHIFSSLKNQIILFVCL